MNWLGSSDVSKVQNRKMWANGVRGVYEEEQKPLIDSRDSNLSEIDNHVKDLIHFKVLCI